MIAFVRGKFEKNKPHAQTEKPSKGTVTKGRNGKEQNMPASDMEKPGDDKTEDAMNTQDGEGEQ